MQAYLSFFSVFSLSSSVLINAMLSFFLFLKQLIYFAFRIFILNVHFCIVLQKKIDICSFKITSKKKFEERKSAEKKTFDNYV